MSGIEPLLVCVRDPSIHSNKSQQVFDPPSMHLRDFHHAPRGPRLFEHWVSHARFPSPIGEFVIELHMAIGDQPDERMIREAERLVREFEQYTDLVVEKPLDSRSWPDRCDRRWD